MTISQRLVALLIALMAGGAFAQEFEVVDIKLNKSGELQAQANVLPSGQFAARNVPLSEIIQFAYDVPANYITGKPGWVDSDRFDIVGKAPAGTADKEFQIMVQHMLAKEFKMAGHTEEKQMNVFAMTIGKDGPKLQAAAEKGEPNCKRVGGPIVNGQVHVACTNFTVSNLAKALPQMASGYIDRPVVDLTELKGSYDFQLDWVGVRFIDQGGLTMPDALAKQLGLKLEQRKLPMPTLVIDKIERFAGN
jgi:uncharacterized protein (TIGR03435 family)